MCLAGSRHPAIGYCSLTIPDLERKRADLRPENPRKSHAQTSLRGTEKEYDLYLKYGDLCHTTNISMTKRSMTCIESMINSLSYKYCKYDNLAAEIVILGS